MGLRCLTLPCPGGGKNFNSSGAFALEIDQVFGIELDRLAEADDAAAAQVDFVAMQAQFLVFAELHVGAVGGTVGQREQAALALDQRVVARYPFGLDDEAAGRVAAERERRREVVDLERLAAVAQLQADARR